MPKALMKMGLSMVLVGHVNFLLGALVHGAVLRHINLNTRARTVAYSISNVVALTTGLVGVVVGILAIILSKNKKSRVLTWSLFVVSLLGSLLATASAIGLTVSVVRATVNGGHSLLAHCRFPNAIGYASITNECPFDPTHVYSMTLILWVPLIVTCIVQLVFSAWCFSVCVSFLGLPCFPHKIRLRDHGRTINTVAPAEKPSLTSSVPAHPLHLHLLQSVPSHLKSQQQPLPPHLHHSDPSHLKSQRQPLPPPHHLHHSNPSHLKSQRQPLPPLPHLHHSNPSHLKSQRQPLPPPHHLHHSDPSHLKSQRQPLPPPHHLHHSNPSHLKSQWQPLPPHLHHSNPSHLKSQWQPLPPPHHLHHSDPSHLKSQRQPLPPPHHLHHSNLSHLKSQQQPLPHPPHLHHSNPSHLRSQRQPLPPPHLHHSNPSHLKSQRQPLRPQHQNQRGRSDRRSDGWQLVPPEEHELLEQGSQQRPSFWI
ncbi:bromodomain-containing protein 4B isoform X2 [Salmo trutta]|nr:bromodomain-containing protein 4B-like isoform X2 [Salmo trutta]